MSILEEGRSYKKARFIDQHSLYDGAQDRTIQLITSLQKFGISTTNVDTPIARSWSFRFLRQDTNGKSLFNVPTFRCCYNRWTSHESVPLPPSPLLHPRSIPDTSSFRSFEQPRRLSSTIFLVRGTVSNRTHSRLHADEYSRTMLIKTKKRPRLYCTYYERKYVLSLPTIVRANDRRQKIGTDEGQRVGFLRDNAKRCRLCNCNKRI